MRYRCERTASGRQLRRTNGKNVRFARLVSSLLVALLVPAAGAAASASLAPRVLVVVAFADDGHSAPTEEAAPWVEREAIDERVRTSSRVSLRCNRARTVCLLISGVGKVNAATSLVALGLDPAVDLRRTYVVVSGIAGVSPETGTIGTAAWARYVVDYDIAHEMDARELPTANADARFEQGCLTGSWCGKAGWRTGTEVFALDPKIVAFAYRLTKNVVLPDPPFVAPMRARYVQAAARAKPRVERCDIVAGDTYWVGDRLGRFARDWTQHWTNGAGSYCMTAMEDAAYAGSMKKLSALGRVDYARFLDLRAGSDFDRPHPGQTALGALRAGVTDGTFPIAVASAYTTSRVVVHYIVAHWSSMQNGVR